MACAIEKQHVADLARLVAIAFQNPDRQIFGRSVGAKSASAP